MRGNRIINFNFYKYTQENVFIVTINFKLIFLR